MKPNPRSPTSFLMVPFAMSLFSFVPPTLRRRTSRGLRFWPGNARRVAAMLDGWRRVAVAVNGFLVGGAFGARLEERRHRRSVRDAEQADTSIDPAGKAAESHKPLQTRMSSRPRTIGGAVDIHCSRPRYPDW